MSYLLRAKKIYKSFHTPEKVEILSGIDLDVYEQQSIAIMGRSGEGKTTLLHILGTLDHFDSGQLEWRGEILPAASRALFKNKNIGFIFQSYNLLEDFTTLDNVLMPARIGRKPAAKDSAAYARGMELLHQVGLQERAHFPARLLSGGEKQRAAIARALCNDPDLILADEPSGNLDHASAEAIHQLLLDAVRIRKKTLILVTHEEKLAGLCDQKILLQRGRLTLL